VIALPEAASIRPRNCSRPFLSLAERLDSDPTTVPQTLTGLVAELLGRISTYEPRKLTGPYSLPGGQHRA
jgi:hypothetical protein